MPETFPPASAAIATLQTAANTEVARATAGEQIALATGGLLPRTHASRAADTFHSKEFGALGDGSGATVGTTYGATLAAMAAYSVNGATPLAWMTDQRYGLTFSMTTSAAVASGATVLPFTRSISSFLGWAATVAVWQDPTNGNYAPRAGMLVTSTTAGIPVGTTIAAGGVNGAPGAKQGNITLSAATTAAIPSGTVVNFSYSPVMLQALTKDEVGIQSAIAAAVANPSGGKVMLPQGVSILTRTLMNTSGCTDPNAGEPILTIEGSNRFASRLVLASDFGPDTAAIKQVNRGIGWYSCTFYRGFRVIGQTKTRVLGAAPNLVQGIGLSAKDIVDDVRVDYCSAGFSLLNDHITMRSFAAPNCGYGVLLDAYSFVIGNHSFATSDMTGPTIASFAVATTNSLDQPHMSHLHLGNCPFGMLGLANPSNVSAALSEFMNNGSLTDIALEQVGYNFIRMEFPRSVDRNVIIGGGFAEIGVTAQQISGDSTHSARLVDGASEFNFNTLIGTGYGYTNVTGGLISAGDILDNTFIGDTSFVLGSTTTAYPFAFTDHAMRNTFSLGYGDGVFRSADAALTAGMLVQDDGWGNAGGGGVNVYTDGHPFLGIALTNMGSGHMGAILTRGDCFSFADAYSVAVPKADTTQVITAGQAAFATTGGVAGGIDQRCAIGTFILGSGVSGLTSAWISLNPNAAAGARGGASHTAGTGTTQATAAATTARIVIVPSGGTTNAGLLLPTIPVGEDQIYINDDAVAKQIWPQGTNTIGLSGAAGAAFTLPASSTITFRRVSSTAWR